MKKMSKHISSRFVSVSFGVLLLCFTVAWYISAAWQEPAAAPPGGNVDIPLNVGPTAQTKSGDLNIGGGLNYWITKSGNSFALKNNAGLINFTMGQDGNIGIGTASPKDKLDIRGHLNLQDGNNASVIYFPNTGASPNFYIRSDDNPSTYEGASERFFIKNTGDVGVGTTNPLFKLDVVGTMHSSGDICTDAGGGKCLSTAGGGGGGAPVDASYVVIGANGTLTQERTLVSGSGITISDGGAGGNVTINNTLGTSISSSEIDDGTITSSDINTGSVQSRVTGNCIGQVMVGINANGTVTCEVDDGGGGGGGNVSTPGGTINRLAKFTNPTDIGNSSVFDNGVFTGVGIIVPDGAERMRVNGSFRVEGNINTSATGGIYANTGQINGDFGIGQYLTVKGIYANHMSVSEINGNPLNTKVDFPGGINVSIGRDITTSGGGGVYAQKGEINAEWKVGSLCIAGDCRNAWPGGGGGSSWTLSGSNLYPNNNSYNVGIGRTNPTEKLHVQGNIRAEGNINTSATGGIYASTGSINGNFSVGNLCLSGQCRNTWATNGNCNGQVMVAISSTGAPVCEADDTGGGSLSTWTATANISGSAGTRSATASCGGGKVLGGGFDIRGGHVIYQSRPSGSNAWQCIVVKNNSENDTCYAVCTN